MFKAFVSNISKTSEKGRERELELENFILQGL